MKRLGDKNIFDVLFVVLFLIFLFIPMSKIDFKTDFSYYEKRYLAKLQPLFLQNYQINYNFASDIDNWFRDRFFPRNSFIRAYFGLQYRLTRLCYSHRDYFLNKKTNYMAYTEPILFQYQSTESIPSMLPSVNKMKKLEEFCKENNIKPYVIISPGKNDIGSSLSHPLLVKSKIHILTLEKIKYLKNFSNIPIIFPYNELVSQRDKNPPIYYKTDSHWTDIGANIAYLAFMDVLKKDFKNIKINKPEDFNTFKSKYIRVCPVYGFYNGNYYDVLNIHDESILDQKYTYLVPKNKKNIYENHETHYKEGYIINKYINKNNTNEPNIFMIGDSNSVGLLPSLVSSFHNIESVFAWGNDPLDMKKNYDIEKYKNDIVNNRTNILLFCSSEISRLEYLFGD